MHATPTTGSAWHWKRGHVGLLFAMAAACLAAQTAPAQSRPQWQLWRIDSAGGGLARLAEMPGRSCGSPEWSPDGRFVAFDTWPVEGTWSESQVAVLRADGSQPPRLLGPGAMPSWSPDGTQLVCHTYDNPQTIVVMNTDGTGRETILNHWGSPRWSPRGNRIASVLGSSIAIFDLATGTERAIVSGPFTVRQGFCISPDGLRYCFPSGTGGLGLATLDERTMHARTRMIVNSHTCYHASWAPDGKRIVFSWETSVTPLDVLRALMTAGTIVPSPTSQLYVLDVDSNDRPAWLPGQRRGYNNVNPDWSPDGKTIVFASQVAP